MQRSLICLFVKLSHFAVKIVVHLEFMFVEQLYVINVLLFHLVIIFELAVIYHSVLNRGFGVKASHIGFL